MAQRRMFSIKITSSDKFTEMPLSAQALYFHLAMNADDDGFVDGVKRVQRSIGAADDDLKLLIAKRFIIPFESGIVVIRQWRVHNYIQKDRYVPTTHTEELRQVEIMETGEKGAYVRVCEQLKMPVNTGVNADVSNLDTKCIQNGYTGKDRVRDRIGDPSIVDTSIHPEEEDIYNTNTAFRAGAGARAREERLFRKYGVLDAAILLSELDAEPVKKAFGDTVDAVLDAAEAKGWKTEMIGLAINKAVNRDRRNPLESPAAYAITLLEDWAERGLDSPEAVAEAKGDFSHYGS